MEKQEEFIEKAIAYKQFIEQYDEDRESALDLATNLLGSIIENEEESSLDNKLADKFYMNWISLIKNAGIRPF